MRHIVLAIGLVLVGGVVGHAIADEEAPDRTKWSVPDRLRALEMEVAALQARERAVSAYVMANAQRADALEALTARCRREGFTSNKNSTRSRITFLNGLDALAKSLRTGLPATTEEEAEAAKLLADFLAAAAKRGAPPPTPAAKPAPKTAPPPPDDDDEDDDETADGN